ncbi:MAG: class I SAM-dependent methyltransferase [Planctomycetes bacterium]|nr:class I SAM-dependent methyltransferase [Planctomycetota bacterium]
MERNTRQPTVAHMVTLLRLLLLTMALGIAGAGEATPPAYELGVKSRDGIGKYFMGREIAQVMGHQGAAWLERPERQEEEDTAAVVRALELKPEWVVADIGCGTGYYSYRMAPSVKEVLGVEIQQEMLDLLMAAGKKKNITNVKPVLGTITDPKLPAGGVDLVLLVDVYHEFDHPVEMLTAIRQSLSATGRVALVEFKAEDPRIPIKPIHKLSEAQARKEFEALGFTWERTVSTLPWQHLIFFKR